MFSCSHESYRKVEGENIHILFPFVLLSGKGAWHLWIKRNSTDNLIPSFCFCLDKSSWGKNTSAALVFPSRKELS